MAHPKQTGKWQRPDGVLLGYTGQYLHEPSEHALDKPALKYAIRGYSGFIPNARRTYGIPSIPSEEIQKKLKKDESFEQKVEVQAVVNDDRDAFRQFAKNMDIHERYALANEQLMAQGKSQQMLIEIVRAKTSQRVRSLAEQKRQLKLIFLQFDANHDGVLDEHEFRKYLEGLNVQFDDVHVLALFAYFDDQFQGCIDWESFFPKVAVPNPRGNTAILPKQIIATNQTY